MFVTVFPPIVDGALLTHRGGIDLFKDSLLVSRRESARHPNLGMPHESNSVDSIHHSTSIPSALEKHHKETGNTQTGTEGKAYRHRTALPLDTLLDDEADAE